MLRAFDFLEVKIFKRIVVVMIAVEMWKASQVVAVVGFSRGSSQVASCEYRGRLGQANIRWFVATNFTHRREQYFRSLLNFSPQRKVCIGRRCHNGVKLLR